VDSVLQNSFKADVVAFVVARKAPNADAGCDSVYNLSSFGELAAGLALKSFVSTNYLLQRSENVAIEKKAYDLVSNRSQQPGQLYDSLWRSVHKIGRYFKRFSRQISAAAHDQGQRATAMAIM
jgi:hypothetical protein